MCNNAVLCFLAIMSHQTLLLQTKHCGHAQQDVRTDALYAGVLRVCMRIRSLDPMLNSLW